MLWIHEKFDNNHFPWITWTFKEELHETCVIFSSTDKQIFTTAGGKLLEGVQSPQDSSFTVPETIQQLDGNDSLSSSNSSIILTKIDRHQTALALPIVATYNLRSLLPKVNSLKTDLIEREIDVAFLQEIWEDRSNNNYKQEVEKMFEENGLLYKSCPRPKTSKAAYGGAALIVNTKKFTFLQQKNIKSINILFRKYHLFCFIYMET